MYKELITNLQTVLEGVSAIKAVYPYPFEGISDKSPYVVFIPDAFDNAMETNAENAKTYRFRIWIAVNLSGTTEQQVFTSILPNAVDKVIQAIDADWDTGTISGHRVRKIISSGFWGLTVEKESKVGWAELSLVVKTLTNV